MTTRSATLLSLMLALTTSTVAAQADSSQWEFFPDRTLFAPFMANHEEPRMGFQKEINGSPMKVAVGSSMELFNYHSDTDTLQGSLQFFVYALADDYRGYLLKIAAADGFFGVSLSYHMGSAFSFRFRALHLSAHLVDGNYNDDLNQWRDNKLPFPFSRNYGELATAYSSSLGSWPLRLYAGFGYAPIVKPKTIKAFSALAGWELHSPGTTHVYAAHHMQLLGTPTYIGSHTIEAGVKLGNARGRGLRLYLVYQNGWDNFSEYYNERKEFVGVGFAAEFWQ